MPADTERLKAVVDRLTPLSTIVTGDLIRAQDWNALVLAIMDVARAVLAEGPVAVPPHEHLGQVKAEWLDARFSTSLQRGPLADPDAAARLTGAEHSVTVVDGRVNGLADQISQLRLRLNEVTSRDLERESQVSSLGLRVTGFNDSRDDVQALRTTLSSVQDALGRALAVAQQLTVDGTPVDVSKWGTRLTDLETFRDGLREPDGSLLNNARFHSDVQAATASLVTKDQLTQVLSTHTTVLTAEQEAAVSDKIATSLRADFSVQMTQLGDSIRAQTDQRLNSLHDVVSSAVADALPSLRDAVLARLRPEVATSIAASAADLQAQMDQKLSDTSTTLRGEFDGKLTGLRTDVTNTVATEVGKQLTIGLQPLQASIADLTTKNVAVSTALTDLSAKSASTADALTKLTASVTAVGQRVEVVDARIDSSVKTLDTAMQKRLADTTASLQLEIKKTRLP